MLFLIRWSLLNFNNEKIKTRSLIWTVFLFVVCLSDFQLVKFMVENYFLIFLLLALTMTPWDVDPKDPFVQWKMTFLSKYIFEGIHFQER